MIRTSVVVCTYNRADMLGGALDSLVEQTLDKDLHEIMVVNNASEDSTAQVVQGSQRKHPECRIVYLYEAVQGLAQARNTGLQDARGEFVAFMDDDARAKPDWLEIALQCFEEADPSPVVAGGVMMPFYTARRPDWFKDKYEIRTG